MIVRRIHITGGAGAGKTRLARRLATMLGAPVYDQDGEALAVLRRLSAEDGIDYWVDPSPIMGQLLAEVGAKMAAFAAQESWVSEGSSLTGAEVLFEGADIVVMLDCAWAVAAYRIVLRHAKAELAGNNRFPGWRQLYRFCRYSVRYYRGANPPGLNDYGVPRNNYHLYEQVKAYESKLVVCRTNREVEALIRRLAEE